LRDFLRQFLLYSRSERRAVVALVVLIVIVLVIPKVYRYYVVRPNAIVIDSTLSKEITEKNDNPSDTNESKTGDANTRGNGLFYFDPNTIDTTEWLRLGLTEKQAKSIEKYISKGGKFKTADDLRRMYVLSDAMKDRLVPYVRIKGISDKQSANGAYIIEINTADSAAFEALYGIGSVLSARIIKYRNSLGGFCRIEQVSEVRGVSDSTFRLIRPHLSVNPALVARININTADYETLQKHPYIRAKIAHAIIGYRNANGKFETLEQLKGLKPITDDIFKKLLPYLKIE
jgi:competence protein ComEA